MTNQTKAPALSGSIAILTGSRSEYHLVRPVARALEDAGTRIIWYVTGMHLVPEYGDTARELERDGIAAARVPMFEPGVASATVHAAAGLAAALKRDAPDFLLLQGDRPEMLAGALAAFDLGIPLLHMHGGDRADSGHRDETIRHAITKLAHVHLAASEESAGRILRMGEEPWRVHVTGSPTIDAAREVVPEPREALAERLGIPRGPYAVVAFHPHDAERDRAGEQMAAILHALQADPSLSLVLGYPNGDPGSEAVIREIERLRGTPGVAIFKNLAHGDYVNVLQHAEFLIGNSSGGIYECSYLGVPTVNVGARNSGREVGKHMVAAEPDALADAIAQVRAPGFRALAEQDRFRFGHGDAAQRIAQVVAGLTVSRERLLQKFMTY